MQFKHLSDTLASGSPLHSLPRATCPHRLHERFPAPRPRCPCRAALRRRPRSPHAPAAGDPPRPPAPRGAHAERPRLLPSEPHRGARLGAPSVCVTRRRAAPGWAPGRPHDVPRPRPRPRPRRRRPRKLSAAPRGPERALGDALRPRGSPHSPPAASRPRRGLPSNPAGTRDTEVASRSLADGGKEKAGTDECATPQGTWPR